MDDRPEDHRPDGNQPSAESPTSASADSRPPGDIRPPGDFRPESDREPRRRPRRPDLDTIFGDVLPATTSDERDPDQPGSDDWYERNRPPHHGG